MALGVGNCESWLKKFQSPGNMWGIKRCGNLDGNDFQRVGIQSGPFPNDTCESKGRQKLQGTEVIPFE